MEMLIHFSGYRVDEGAGGKNLAIGKALALALLGMMATAVRAETPAEPTAEAGAVDGLAEELVEEEPANLYLADILVFAYDSVDTSAEHWSAEGESKAAVLQLFYPNLGEGGGYGGEDKLDFSGNRASFAKDKTLETSRFVTPIDNARSRLGSLQASELLRRQMIINEFEFKESPKVRLNDFQVYLPKPPEVDSTAAGPAGRGAGKGHGRAPMFDPLADVPRCRQDGKRRLTLNKYADALDEFDFGGASTITPDQAMAMFSDGAGSGEGDGAEGEETLEDAPTVDDFVQLALMGSIAGPPSEESWVLEEIDLDNFGANRVDGHIKLFYSRFHHTELQLQFLRPFLTDSGLTPAASVQERKPCLLAFNIWESRRLEVGKIHFFDHPAFGALLFFDRWEPEPEEDSIEGNSVDEDPIKEGN